MDAGFKTLMALERLRESYLQRAKYARQAMSECTRKETVMFFRGQNSAYLMSSRLLTLLINRGVE
jgi:hypothetical protein